MKHKRRILLSIFILNALALASCGSDNDGKNKNTVTLSGTAAIGAAISGGTLTAKCADGSGFAKTVSTSADGTWSGEINNDALPCALKISGGTPAATLHSFVVSAGVTNVTPLTDLALALITSTEPAIWFTNFTGSALDITNAGNQLLDTLENKGFTIPSTGNPFTTAFSADGTGWDALLDDIGAAINADPNLADYTALLNLVKDGNLSNLPSATGGEGSELPANIDVLTAFANTYAVSGTATNPDRGTATRNHDRGTIIISANGDVDFDTNISFTGSEIGAIYDRRNICDLQDPEACRIHVNYDEDDSGRKLELFLAADKTTVLEIRYQDGLGGLTRAAIVVE